MKMNQMLGLATLFVCLSVNAKPELKGNPDELRQFLHPHDKIVTLSADAEEKAYSDKAMVSLVVTTEKDKLADAIEKNSALRDKVTGQLVAAGIKRENIKTSKFSTSPQYGWFGKKPDSYKVVNRMSITIFDESQMKALAGAADTNKEIAFSTTEFEHTKKDEFKNKVKTQALKKVMTQKAFYEKELGVLLTPINFRDANIGFKGTRAAVEMDSIVMQDAPMVSGSASFSKMRTSKPKTTSFDEVKYYANISVDFKIISTK